MNPKHCWCIMHFWKLYFKYDKCIVPFAVRFFLSTLGIHSFPIPPPPDVIFVTFSVSAISTFLLLLKSCSFLLKISSSAKKKKNSFCFPLSLNQFQAHPPPPQPRSDLPHNRKALVWSSQWIEFNLVRKIKVCKCFLLSCNPFSWQANLINLRN